jgi:cell division protein FtsL
MSGGTVKLRAVFAWIALMLLIVSLPLAQVWKQQTFVRLSRELIQAGRDRDALATDVLVLETETRALGQLSRLETVARERLGLINPGPPTVIQPEGQVLAQAGETVEGSTENGSSIKSAKFEFLKGLFQ